jgi:hypothetical protein
MRTVPSRVLLAAAALSVAPSARAQFVQLTRCQSAYPCSLPIGLLYKPEPIIAGAYGNVPSGAGLFSLKIDPSKPLQVPVLDLSKVVENQDFARDAARIFVLRYPAPKAKPSPPTPPTPPEGAAQPAKN